MWHKLFDPSKAILQKNCDLFFQETHKLPTLTLSEKEKSHENSEVE